MHLENGGIPKPVGRYLFFILFGIKSFDHPVQYTIYNKNKESENNKRFEGFSY